MNLSFYLLLIIFLFSHPFLSMLSINALRNLSRNRVVTSSNKLLKRASPILRGITLGSLVLSLFPSQTSCVGEEENKKPNFEKTSPKTSVLDKETFDFNKFIASQLDEKGPFHEVKNFFESGMAGQIGYGFLMGYSSGFCIKKVSNSFSLTLSKVSSNRSRRLLPFFWVDLLFWFRVFPTAG